MTNTIVQEAQQQDLNDYLDLLSDFHHASTIAPFSKFDRQGCALFLENCIKNNDIGIWVAKLNGKIVGVTAALVYPLYFSPTHSVVQELWWWLTPEARGSGAGQMMYKQIEQWAKEKNAKSIFMIALEDEKASKMEKVYNRSGFTALERTFIKEVA